MGEYTRIWQTKSEADPVSVGEVVQIKKGATEATSYGVVTSAKRPHYVAEDGLSFHLPWDSGWTQTYTARPATAEEAAPLVAEALAKIAVKDAKVAAQEAAVEAVKTARAAWIAAHPDHAAMDGYAPPGITVRRVAAYTREEGRGWSGAWSESEDGEVGLFEAGAYDDQRSVVYLPRAMAWTQALAWMRKIKSTPEEARRSTQASARLAVEALDAGDPDALAWHTETRAQAAEQGVGDAAIAAAAAKLRPLLAAAVADGVTYAQAREIVALYTLPLRKLKYTPADPLKEEGPILDGVEDVANGVGGLHREQRYYRLVRVFPESVRKNVAAWPAKGMAYYGGVWVTEAGDRWLGQERVTLSAPGVRVDVDADVVAALQPVDPEALLPLTYSEAVELFPRLPDGQVKAEVALINTGEDRPEVQLFRRSAYLPTNTAIRYLAALGPTFGGTVISEYSRRQARLNLTEIPAGKVRPVVLGTLVFHENGRIDREPAADKHGKRLPMWQLNDLEHLEAQTRAAFERVKETGKWEPVNVVQLRLLWPALDYAWTDLLKVESAGDLRVLYALAKRTYGRLFEVLAFDDLSPVDRVKVQDAIASLADGMTPQERFDRSLDRSVFQGYPAGPGKDQLRFWDKTRAMSPYGGRDAGERNALRQALQAAVDGRQPIPESDVAVALLDALDGRKTDRRDDPRYGELYLVSNDPRGRIDSAATAALHKAIEASVVADLTAGRALSPVKPPWTLPQRVDVPPKPAVATSRGAVTHEGGMFRSLKGGGWGVQVKTLAVQKGDWIETTRKDGHKATVRVLGVIERDSTAGTTLVSFADK